MKEEQKEYSIFNEGDKIVFKKNSSKEVIYILLGAVLLLSFTIYQNKHIAETVAYVVLELLAVTAIIVGKPIAIEIDSAGLAFRHRLFPGITFARYLKKDKLIAVKSMPYSFGIPGDKQYIAQVRVVTSNNRSHTVFTMNQKSMAIAQLESDKLATVIAGKLGVSMQPFVST